MKYLRDCDPKVGQRYTVMYGSTELTGVLVYIGRNGGIIMNLDKDVALKTGFGWPGTDYAHLGSHVAESKYCWWVSDTTVIRQHKQSYKQIFRDMVTK